MKSKTGQCDLLGSGVEEVMSLPLALLLAAVGTRPGGVEAGGVPLRAAPGHRLAAFSRGCFWGMEERFRREPGVVATAVGYMGGTEAHPTYESIHAHRTGHLETVLVEFDPRRVPYARLLDAFEASKPGSRSMAWAFGADQLRAARARFPQKASLRLYSGSRRSTTSSTARRPATTRALRPDFR